MFQLSNVLGRLEGISGEDPYEIARHLRSKEPIVLRADMGLQPVFPAYVPRGQAPLHWMPEPAASVSEAFGQHCMETVGRGFGCHMVRRWALVQAETRYLADHPGELGVDDATRRGVGRGFGWMGEGMLAYETAAIDTMNYVNFYALGFQRSNEWARQHLNKAHGAWGGG